jgi:hypothetical protein
MRILDRDELDEQRKNYMRYIGAFNKLAKGVGDGSLKGEQVRDMTLILQGRFLTFILSELVHMSEMLRVTEDQIESKFGPEMEDQAEIEFDDATTAKIEAAANGYDPISEEIREAEEADGYSMDADEVHSALDEIDADGQDEEEASGYDPISEEPLDSSSEELEDVSPAEPEYERGSTDLLGRFRGLGLVPDEESPAEHITEESGDEAAPLESDETLGPTAELLSALADIEADKHDDAPGIVDDIYKQVDEDKDEEAD